MTRNGDAVTVDRAAAHLLRDLAGLGRSWASYGLTVGKLAVEQSARSMEHLARVLDDAADLLAGLSRGLKDDAAGPPAASDEGRHAGDPVE